MRNLLHFVSSWICFKLFKTFSLSSLLCVTYVLPKKCVVCSTQVKYKLTLLAASNVVDPHTFHLKTFQTFNFHFSISKCHLFNLSPAFSYTSNKVAFVQHFDTGCWTHFNSFCIRFHESRVGVIFLQLNLIWNTSPSKVPFASSSGYFGR